MTDLAGRQTRPRHEVLIQGQETYPWLSLRHTLIRRTQVQGAPAGYAKACTSNCRHQLKKNKAIVDGLGAVDH